MQRLVLQAGQQLVLTSYVHHPLSDDVAVSDIRRLADSGADVIGLQEMASLGVDTTSGGQTDVGQVSAVFL